MYTPRVSAVARTSYKSQSATLAPGTRRGINLSLQALSTGSQFNQTYGHVSRVIIDETPNYRVEGFGSMLPVLVTEALTMAEKDSEISVKLSDSGWAWLVCGRRLFIWKYNSTSGPRTLSSQCRELNLPQSALNHTADLVCVYTTSESQIPSAVAISPEGIVRYWPSIAHEGSSLETNAELQGQECYSLTNAQPLGCILATTTGTLVQIIPVVQGGQSSVTCRPMKLPQGIIAGIGRRVSSFIFGSMPSSISESKLVKVIVADTEKEDEKLLFVLTDNNLQKWLLSKEFDKVVFECDINRFVKEKFCEEFGGHDVYLANQVRTWLIDMQLTENGVVVLAAGMHPQGSQEVHYSFGTLPFDGNCIPLGFSHFVNTKAIDQYRQDEEESLFDYHFLLTGTKKDTAHMYKSRFILCMSVSKHSDEPAEKIEFHSPTDKILGAGIYDKVPLFFTTNHGIVSVNPLNQSMEDESDEFFNESAASVFELSDEFMQSGIANETTVAADENSRLKAAFLLYSRHKLLASQTAVDNLFPPSVQQSFVEADKILNKTIITLSEALVDDYPASDPRWAESVPIDASGTTHSMLIQYQLEDKQKAHEVYINFLKSVGLWNRMSLVIKGDRTLPTRLLLLEHYEKLAAMLTLHNLQAEYGSIIDTAIKQILKTKEMKSAGKLTHQDLFYREVTAIQQIIPALIKWQEATTDASMQEYVSNVVAVNKIIQVVLQEACLQRNTKSALFSISSNEPDVEYLPWTASVDSDGIRPLLMKQHILTVEVINQGVEDVDIKGRLFQNLVELADLVLDGYRVQLESISNTGDTSRYQSVNQLYHENRTALISPLMKFGQYERAAAIAEKHYDFATLMRLCEETDDQNRLQRYMVQFADKNFSDFSFRWYLEEGKRGKLLSQPTARHGDLQRFLEQHKSLSWLHDIETKDYRHAQETLNMLALSECDILSRKKTLLSLSKLTAILSDESPDETMQKMNAIDKEQEQILYQETLPAAVLDNCGLDPENMRVMSPVELIELYISSENVGSNEFDFKKALDLLQFIDKESSSVDTEALKLHIWCRAILKDTWDDIDGMNPLESCRETYFFKTVDLVFIEGLDLHEYLPSVENLINAEELGSLRDSSAFQYLVQAGYEYLMSLSTSDKL